MAISGALTTAVLHRRRENMIISLHIIYVTNERWETY